MHLIQKEYGWSDRYICPDWTDLPDEYLSYERWLQIIEVLKRDKEYERYERLENMMLVCWDIYQNNPYKSKPYIKNFEDFMRKKGIKHPLRRGRTKKHELEEANKVLDELGITNVLRSVHNKRQNKH